MRISRNADTAKLTASTSTAHAAVKAPISAPAMDGPATCDPARLNSSFAFPSMTFSRATSDGR
jgi:hypothetical protein